MSLDPIKRLAENLAVTSNEQETVKQNLSGDDTEALLQLQNSESLIMSGSLEVRKYNYATDSFVIDHPVYGDINSSTLIIDGGYAQNQATFTLTFPVTLGVSTQLLYSTTF